MINPIFEIDNYIYDEVFLIWRRGDLVPYEIQLEEFGYFRPTLRYKDSLITFVDTQQSAELFVKSHDGFFFTVLRNIRKIGCPSVLSASCSRQINEKYETALFKD